MASAIDSGRAAPQIHQITGARFPWYGGSPPAKPSAFPTGIPDDERQWAAGVARQTSRRHGVDHHAMLTSRHADLPTMVARRAFVRTLVRQGWLPLVIERHFGMPKGSASPTLVIPNESTDTPESGEWPHAEGIVHRDLKPENARPPVVLSLHPLPRKPLPVHKAERVIPAGPRPPFGEPRPKGRLLPKCKHRSLGIRCRHDATEDGSCAKHVEQHRAGPPPRCPALRPHGKACGHMTVRNGLCALHAQRKDHGIEVRIGGEV